MELISTSSKQLLTNHSIQLLRVIIKYLQWLPHPHHESTILPTSHLTTSTPPHLTSFPPPHFTSSPPPHFTSSLPHHFTSSPPSHLTSSPPPHLTSSPPPHLTSSPQPHFTSSPPYFPPHTPHLTSSNLKVRFMRNWFKDQNITQFTVMVFVKRLEGQSSPVGRTTQDRNT